MKENLKIGKESIINGCKPSKKVKEVLSISDDTTRNMV